MNSVLAPKRKGLRVFMMDFLAVVAYYDAYLCRALQSEGASVILGSITYHLDRDCFKRLGLKNDPGMLNIIGKLRLPAPVRRILKVFELILNILAQAVRFTWAPPHVVHVQYLPLLERHVPVELWFLRYLRFLGSSLVCTIHDVLPHDTGKTLTHDFRKAYGMMDALICHSEAAKEQLLSLFSIAPEIVYVIPHGPLFFDHQAPDLRASGNHCQSESGECVVLCHGMIRPYKGIEFLIDAWAELQQSGVKAKLVIAGTGDPVLLNRISHNVRSLGLENSVQLCFGFAPPEQMISYYRMADIVVYPYKAITTSGALMTGIAQRKAIIATALAPFRELLEHERNALLCEYGDTAGLASALARLILDPMFRERLAKGASTLSCGDEAWRQIATQTKNCYALVTGRQQVSELERSLAA